MVTNVDSGNTRITITSTNNYTLAPGGAVAADVLVLKSRIVATGCSGMTVNGQLGLIDKLALIGDATSGKAGLDLLFNVSEQAASFVCGDIGINGWATGIASWGSNRIRATSTGKPCIGNCTTGIQSSFASSVMFPNGSAIAGCTNGTIASYMGTIYLNGATVSGCSTYGLRASGAGMNQIYGRQHRRVRNGRLCSGQGVQLPRVRILFVQHHGYEPGSEHGRKRRRI